MILKYILFFSILSGCANISSVIKPITTAKRTPTKIINDFSNQTQKMSLNQAIESEELPQKKDEYFLKDNNGEKVQFWMNYYGNRNKDQFERFAHNGERYRKVIEEIFEKYSLPKELYYVGFIESGYQNHAKSHAGAVGPWQFIKSTARRYGLIINQHVDERKNIYKSTEAAALFFQDLYNIFGSWELALAGYNAGEYGIIRRIRKANTREYYELSKQKVIPKETRHYIPKILAVKKLHEQANKYELNIPVFNNNPFENISTQKIFKATSIKDLADHLKISQATIKLLNPDILHHYLTPHRKGMEIVLPKNNYQEFAEFQNQRQVQSEIKIEDENESEHQIHTVRKNESLYSISKRYNVDIEILKKQNHIKSSYIRVGQKLNLPFKQYSKIISSYTVKKGDSLINLSKMYRTTPGQIKKLNHLNSSRIYIGQKLKVPPHKRVTYTVKKGDYLIQLAEKFDTSLRILKDINNVRNKIYPGQELVIKITLL